jgi:hypothetical protein
MPTLRGLQAEWNRLVDEARPLGIYVRPIRSLHESIEHGTRRVSLLSARIASRRARLRGTTAPITPAALPAVLTFGVEIECYVAGRTREEVALAITAAGVECRAESYNHQRRPAWKVVTDNSVAGGMELVSPVLSGEAGFQSLQTVCRVLGELGATVRRTCGLHVHVGVHSGSPAFFRRIHQIYAGHEAAINSVLSPSRRANGFCRAMPDHINTYTHQPLDMSARYGRVNFQSFWRHGTVEFRQHQGTVEFTKIAAWVRFCQAIVRLAGSDADLPVAQDIDGLTRDLGLSTQDTAYFNSRARHFATRTSVNAA